MEIDPVSGEVYSLATELQAQQPGDLVALPPFLRSGFNYDRDLASRESGLACADPSLAQQQFLEEVDINTIVRRFGITGELPHNGRAPTFGDFETVVDYQSAMQAIRDAEEAFMALPGAVRYDRFNNDPQRFVAFCSDPANLPALRDLGLANPLEVSHAEVQGVQAKGEAQAQGVASSVQASQGTP